MKLRQRRADRRQRSGTSVDLNLVSLIDVFTILIFFLLASSGEIQTLVAPPGVRLPLARADQAPRQGLELAVAGQRLLLQGQPVADLSEGGLPPLRDALRAHVDPAAAAPPALVLVADRDLPYHWLRALMRTAADAGLNDVSFAVRRQEGA